MYWKDEGYLLSKNNLSENTIIIEVFTLNHGKYNGVVYGGSSRKKKNIFQIGNKILLDWNSKSENKIGYFKTEFIYPVSPLFFDNKKKSICIFSATSILRILLPERQINKKIYLSFEKFINDLNNKNWILLYILWELSLIKELGFETNLEKAKLLIHKLNNKDINFSNAEIKSALTFNKNLILENFITPNKIKFPIYRNILEKYFT